jgi:hypothetical protein
MKQTRDLTGLTLGVHARSYDGRDGRSDSAIPGPNPTVLNPALPRQGTDLWVQVAAVRLNLPSEIHVAPAGSPIMN